MARVPALLQIDGENDYMRYRRQVPLPARQEVRS